MSGRRGGRTPGAFLLALCVASAVCALPHPLRADAQSDRRVELGLKLFRTLLQADLDLAKKATDGKLLVVFVHIDDGKRAAELAKEFGKKEILGLPLEVVTTSDGTLAAFEKRPPAGIFLTQAPDSKTLAAIVKAGIDRGVIVYSPFEGHVEKGVLGGISVEAQVRPYLNEATLNASRISLKGFFLSVAKVYR